MIPRFGLCCIAFAIALQGCSQGPTGPGLAELQEIIGSLPEGTSLLASGINHAATDQALITNVSEKDASCYWIVLSQNPLDCPLDRNALGMVEIPNISNSQAVVATIGVQSVKNFVAANYGQVDMLPQITADDAFCIEWQKGTKEIRIRECQADVRWLSIIETHTFE